MIYLNNKLVPKGKAMVSVYDHGFLYGDGIYETLRVYDGVVFKLSEHIDRLFSSASMIGLSVPKSPAAITGAVYKTLSANKHKDAVVRITVSRGAGPLGLDPGLCPKPTFVIMTHAFKPYPRRSYQKGLSIAIVNTKRNYGKALNPQIKSLNFLNNILAKIEAKEMDVQEAIMLNYRGYIAEGTVSNIFFVRDSTLCTPSLKVGILGGITRSIILALARKSKIRLKEGQFKPVDLYEAQEVFISNTTMEVMPVHEINNKIISDTPGQITKKLRQDYNRAVRECIKGVNK
jgi:branched-chain amino acid aminotransferase